jgi:hypothetical protein
MFPTANRGGVVEFQGSEMMLSIPFSGRSARSERTNCFCRGERSDGPVAKRR